MIFNIFRNKRQTKNTDNENVANPEVVVTHFELVEFLELLFNQEPEFVPKYFRYGERNKKYKISSVEDVLSLSNGDGGFVENDYFQIMILDWGRSRNAFFQAKKGFDAEKFIYKVAALRIGYAAAYIYEEYENRNILKYVTSHYYGERKLGQEYTHYLPGLYWKTIIPIEMVNRLNIDIESIRGIAKDVEIIGNINYLVTMFERPEEWRKYANIIDDWCYNHNNCFSVRRLKEQINKNFSAQEYDDLFERFRFSAIGQGGSE